MAFKIIEENEIVAIYLEVLEELGEIKKDDKDGYNRIMNMFLLLSRGMKFNKDEQWRPLKGRNCKKHKVWELKPKPYRVAFFKDNFKDKEVFVFFAIWRKKSNKEDKRAIEKACREVETIIKIWENFKGGK